MGRHAASRYNFPMNSTISRMLAQHPRIHVGWQEQVSWALAALAKCEQVCMACADACLDEEKPETLRHCIRLNLSCAAVCHAMSQVLHHQSELTGSLVQEQLQPCITICGECATECQQHARHHAHCRICADVCLQCQESCSYLLTTLAA